MCVMGIYIVFKRILSLTVFIYVAFGASVAYANNCANEMYRRYNPDKCINVEHGNNEQKLSFATATTITGGTIALVGGAIALIGGTSNDAHHHQSTPTPTLPIQYDMVGADVDEITMAAITTTREYTRNINQYNDIRAAYSLARGYTGAGSNIAVFDAAPNTWHARNVAYMAGGHIAPNANVDLYQISQTTENFYSFHEIGDVIQSVTNANIYNFSWSATNIFATDVKNKQHLEKITDKNFIDAITNAAVKNDAILVWAAGNDYKSQSSAMSTIPLHVPETNGHFVNVVAWDSNTGALADFSNACGITKNYCITAPGTDLESPKTTKPLNGTSFAAPIVSAAIAVIRQAFPYMKSTEITQLLFTTARDLGEIGVDEIYGHGMLDLERATRPVGAALVPIQNNANVALNTVRVSGAIGHKIKSENLTFSFVDEFGRAFETKLNDNISVKNRGIGYERLTNNHKSVVQFNNIKFGFKKNNMFQSNGFVGTESDPITTFIGFSNNINMGRANLFWDAEFGTTKPHSTNESIISEFSNIMTASAKIGISHRDFTFSVGTPDTIISGNVYLNVPIGRNTNGEYMFRSQSINLAGKPAVEYSANYRFITVGFVDNPYGTDEIYTFARGKIFF